MKRIIFVGIVLLLIVFVAGCAQTEKEIETDLSETSQAQETATTVEKPEQEDETNESQFKQNIKIVLITDSGDVADGRFNQETWEGVTRAAQELGLEYDFF